MLVFSCDLKEVEEICCGGMYAYDILIGGRFRVWEVGDFEFAGTLYC